MKLVRIRENVMVNPDMICCLEFQEVNGRRSCVITLNNSQQWVVTVQVEELLSDLINAGMEPNSQFFAG